MKLFGVLLRRNISKINITVKLKRQWFLLIFLAYNFKIHKTIDSNKIELQDIRKIFYKNNYKNIFFWNTFHIRNTFFTINACLHHPLQPQALIWQTITQIQLLPAVCLIFNFTYFQVVDNLWITCGFSKDYFFVSWRFAKFSKWYTSHESNLRVRILAVLTKNAWPFLSKKQ